MDIKVGDYVETSVFVGSERRPTGEGMVVAVHSGYCDIDHCFPYGTPWIYPERTDSLIKIRRVKERRGMMEIKIEKWQVEKILTKLIPPRVFEGQEISRIEAHYDGSMSIHLTEIEEEGKEAIDA